MLSVEHARPSLELAPYLHGYVQRVSDPRAPEIVEPVVARSGSMLEFQFGEPFDVPIYGLDLPNLSVPITIFGAIPARNTRIVIRGRVESLTVLFRPLGLYTIFGIPLARFTGMGTEGSGVLGAPVRALYEQLGNLRTFPERVSTLEPFLVQHLHRGRSLDPAHRALQWLASAGRQITVQSVAAQAGISTRKLERISLEYCGVTPVLLTRLTRFQRALWLRQQTSRSWIRIAHSAGYHDQMHMIRDFRQAKQGRFNPFPDVYSMLAISSGQMLLFAGLVSVGLLLRRDGETHKRLLLMAPMLFFFPSVGRLFHGISPLVLVLALCLYSSGPIYDLVSRRQIHTAYRWGVPLLILTMPPFPLLLSHAAAWHRFVDKLLG